MKNTWLTSNSICIAKGDAVALNLMFETQEDHELFLRFWKKYLGKMATLLNYHLSPTGWTLLFKTRSTSEITAAYLEQRKKSKKAKKERKLTDCSRILSEHFRIFLSQFVRRSNAKNKRKGTKVMERFHKYILNEHSDYEYFFEKITRQQREPVQHKKYRADERKYDIKKEMEEDSIWKVGTRLYMGLEKEFRLRFGVGLLEPSSSVLRNFWKTSNLKIPLNRFT